MKLIDISIVIILIFILKWGLSEFFMWREFRKHRETREYFFQKPFALTEATCDKNKIFSAIRGLEEKIDEMEYDIFKQNQKLKKYDETYLKYQKNQEIVQKKAESAKKKLVADLEQDLKDSMKQLQQQGNQNLSSEQFRAQSSAIDSTMSRLERAEEKLGKQTIGLEATSAEGQQIVDGLDDIVSGADPIETEELRKNIQSLNIPPGIL